LAPLFFSRTKSTFDDESYVMKAISIGALNELCTMG
jgi:hypothetical protein